MPRRSQRLVLGQRGARFLRVCWKGRFTMRVVKALLTYIIILLTIFVLIVLFKHHVHPDDALFFAGILAIPATYLWRKYSAVEH